MSYIKFKINGYTNCTLLGKALIATRISGTGYVSMIVKATTLVESRHESLKIKLSHIKTSRQIGTEGYLVYFGTSTAGWFELVPLDDARFSTYENKLIGKKL